MLVVRRELFAQPRARPCPAAAPSPTSTRSSTSTSTTRRTARRAARPAIVESIRAGLVFQLKDAVGVEAIRAREDDFSQRAIAPLGRAIPTIEILGNLDAERLSIVSFVVRAPERPATCTTTSSSRCSTTCSASSRAAAARAPGPYGHRLLGIDIERSHEFEREIAAAARGSSPAGCGSTSTTSSPRPCSTTSLDAVALVAERRLAAAARLPVRPGDRACGGTAAGRSSRRCGCADVALRRRRRDDLPAAPTARRRESRSPATSTRPARCSLGRRRPPPTRRPRRRGRAPTSSSCAGSGSPRRWARPIAHVADRARG